jgi:hypothetical protein
MAAVGKFNFNTFLIFISLNLFELTLLKKQLTTQQIKIFIYKDLQILKYFKTRQLLASLILTLS